MILQNKSILVNIKTLTYKILACLSIRILLHYILLQITAAFSDMFKVKLFIVFCFTVYMGDLLRPLIDDWITTGLKDIIKELDDLWDLTSNAINAWRAHIPKIRIAFRIRILFWVGSFFHKMFIIFLCFAKEQLGPFKSKAVSNWFFNHWH